MPLHIAKEISQTKQTCKSLEDLTGRVIWHDIHLAKRSLKWSVVMVSNMYCSTGQSKTNKRRNVMIQALPIYPLVVRGIGELRAASYFIINTWFIWLVKQCNVLRSTNKGPLEARQTDNKISCHLAAHFRPWGENSPIFPLCHTCSAGST